MHLLNIFYKCYSVVPVMYRFRWLEQGYYFICSVGCSQSTNFMERQSVTTKFIYNNMLEYRCIPPRVLTIHPAINFSETWKWVQCYFVQHTGIFHGVSPTKFYLHKGTCTSLSLLEMRNVIYVSCLLNL